MKTLRDNSAVRYLIASVGALALDYVATLGLFHVVGLSLTVSAGLAFLGVGLVFYFIHEHWTFRREGSAFSSRRMAGNLAVLLAAGAVRILVILLLETMREPFGIWVTIYFGAGVICSFITNFVLNRFLIFRS